MIWFLVLIFLVGTPLVFAGAQDGVMVSKPSRTLSSLTVEQFVQQVVLEFFQDLVREIMEQAVRRHQLPFSAHIVDNMSSQAAYLAIQEPSVSRIIREIYVEGIRRALAQMKEKASQLGMEDSVRQVVNMSIRKVVSDSSFQKVLDRVLSQTLAQYRQNNLKQTVMVQQRSAAVLQRQFQKTLSDVLESTRISSE